MTKGPETFLVDCDQCKAKVAAIQDGVAVQEVEIYEHDPYPGARLHVGKCPKCSALLAGYSAQTAIADYDSKYDEWTDPVRVYPNPPRVLSQGVPPGVRKSMSDAEICIQAGVETAACVMLGHALEGLCRDQLKDDEGLDQGSKPGRLMLGEGLKNLRKRGVIDEKLLAWSTQLQVFRNAAAHPDEDVVFTRVDVLDLRTFAYAIIEYVYDLNERYNEFVARANEAKARVAVKKGSEIPPKQG